MRLDFSLSTTEDILKRSVVEITEARCVLGGAIVKNGPRDERLGCAGRGRCVTCGESRCGGHNGHVCLAAPVFNVLHVPALICRLKIFCDVCGERRGDVVDAISTDFSAQAKALGHKKCASCGAPPRKFKWCRRRASIVTNDDALYSAEQCLAHLKDKAEGYVMKVFPVISTVFRPSIMDGGRTRSEHDLTYRIQSIVRESNTLRKWMEEKRPDVALRHKRIDLQNAVTCYIDYRKASSTSKSSSQERSSNRRNYKSIKDVVTGKEGRIRGQLCGKRCDFSARGVASGDNFLKSYEVGIPRSIARKLTIPLKVTDYNRQSLEETKTERIMCIVHKNGARTKDVARVDLEVGMTVERMLMDGDVVLVNRQPTLHKGSMQGHVVKLLPYSTIRINDSICAPYNADFDGDELNVHVLQDLEARVEAEELMLATNHMISPSSRPLQTLIQDTVIGLFLLCEEPALTRDECSLLGVFVEPPLTGRRVLSALLPKDLHYERGTLRIVGGQILSGELSSKNMGRFPGSLLHVLHNDYGGRACADIMHELQRVAAIYLEQIRGFTLHFAEVMCTDTDLRRRIREEIDGTVAQATEMKTVQERLPYLNACRNRVATIIDSSKSRNNMDIMIDTGAKGKTTNKCQIQGLVGQMCIEGSELRPKNGFWRGKTLPCFDEDGPLSRGFIDRSFADGLTGPQQFVSAMSGSTGIVDTAVKTAKVGYFIRKVMSGLKNVTVDRRGMVIESGSDRVIAMRYGDDGLDGSKLEFVPIAPVRDAGDDLAFLRRSLAPGRKTMAMFCSLPRILQKLGPKPPASGDRDCFPMIDTFSRKFSPLHAAYLRLHIPSMDICYLVRLFDIIEDKYERAKIPSAECVGAIAAASLGEPTQQCTLNSVDWHTRMITTLGAHKPIGEIIDALFEASADPSQTSIEAPPGAMALTADAEGVPSWKPLTHVTRHPPENEDGSDLLVKITTASGRELRATRAKSFIVVDNGALVPRRGADIKVGDVVPIVPMWSFDHCGNPEMQQITGAFLAGRITSDDVAEGWVGCDSRFVGELFIDFLRSREISDFLQVVRLDSHAIFVPEAVVNDYFTVNHVVMHNSRFGRALLKGYADIRGRIDDGHFCIHVVSDLAKELLMFILTDMNITFTTNDDVIRIHYLQWKGIQDIVKCGEKFCRKFLHSVKKPQLERTGFCAHDVIVSVEQVPSSKPLVYDLTVEGTKNMVCMHGMVCRDTFHMSGIAESQITGGGGLRALSNIIDHRSPDKVACVFKGRASVPETLHTLKRVRFSDVLVSIGPSRADDTERLRQEFWIFPDDGFPTEMPAFDEELDVDMDTGFPGGRPTRVELYPYTDVDAVSRAFRSIGCFAACTEGPRMVCWVYGSLHHDFKRMVLSGYEDVDQCIKVPDDRVEATLGVQDCVEMFNDIQLTSLTSNDIEQMKQKFGIEAARSSIIQNIEKTLGFYGISVGRRHLQLVADYMTWTGDVLPYNRHGLRKQDASVLMMAGFEEMMKVLSTAAVGGKTDKCADITSQVITGKTVTIGPKSVNFDVIKDPIIERCYEQPRPEKKMDDIYADMGSWIPMAVDVDGTSAGGHFVVEKPLYDMAPKSIPPSKKKQRPSPKYRPPSPKYCPPSPKYYPPSPKYCPPSPT